MPMLSTRTAGLKPSPIREILAVLDRPGMVSFAGGLPAPETFPTFSGGLAEGVLQYGPTEGEPALRKLVAQRLAALGIDTDAERVLILSGSQQGIDLVAKLFVDPGTPVATESPTYLAALQVFRFFGASFVPLTFHSAPAAPLAYVVPTFANPTGRCASATQRAALAASCLARGVTLFEDDPYRDLAYSPCERRPVVAGMAGGSWIYQGSFSKTLAPGLRLGYLTASTDLFWRLQTLKGAADLHSSRLGQSLVLDQLSGPDAAARTVSLVDFYRTRRDAFAALLERHFGDLATWGVPAGGLFFWLRLHRRVDTRELLPDAIARGVAFMPGEEFYPQAPELGTMRLNFSHASPTQAERGLARLAALLRARRG